MSIRKLDPEAMSVEDLWSLHEEISRILSARITSEKRELEKRLAVLNHGRDTFEGTNDPQSAGASSKTRRRYPRVSPKYCNPQVPSETWSGRGKRPRWLVAAMKSGRKIEDFKIGDAGGSRADARGHS